MKIPSLKKLLLPLIVLLILGGFGWVVTQQGPLAPVQVTVAPVVRQAIAASVFGIGTVEARYSYRIGPTAAGRIKQVLVDVGDSVQAGQTLAVMEGVDLDARIQAAGLAAERATASIATAVATLKLTQTENRRTTSLAARALVSQSSADTSQQQAAIALAALDVAKKEQQRLQAEQKALRQQQANLTLTAPVAGMITTRDAESGTTLVAGQPVLTLADPQSYWVKARIDQSQALGLQVGQVASITLRSAPQQVLTGKLTRIEPVSDSITEERLVGIAFTPVPASLSSGELAEVTLQTGQKSDALVIPNAAIQQHDGQTGVWKLNGDSTLQFTPIQTGIQSLDGQVEILSGLQADDNIVVYTSKALSAASKIKVVQQLAGVKP
ncbi:efflux RND transporter periplasmic adaptor subunit [Thiothrix fructosivorans]|uniref:Efflux RND transporter periplasmic adaptor subunit n=1 Tax=Thiothrix fructosivorans TaxID=111770 RepID=A0A8B0SL41_9GAMM|nr:efflux RND transporter periplasmic adaptor subunit [Thiothrix fructosivorans]MBO0611458.1 efflux RND transporter periplasmic adaptor subunit [Thiothrix fructosivorans]QTX12983.1 efflux RND transporter periplasmic adaptor subunit [Thiothrix fructosivorans]